MKTNITYRDLLNIFSTFTEEQLDMTVSTFITNEDEYASVISVKFTDEETNDVLDENHPVLVVDY